MKAGFTITLTALFALFFAGQSSIAQEKKDASKDTFLVVEDMPQFKDGDVKDFNTWVASKVKYPKIALQNGIKGTVFCEYVVSKNGKVTDVKIKRGVDPALDNEVIRVVKSSPEWTAGKQRGKAVDVKMVVPVKFALD